MRALTEVCDARGLGLDLVGDAQERPYLQHKGLRELLAVELQRRRQGTSAGARLRGARAGGRHHVRRRKRRRRRGRPPLRRRRRRVPQRPARRAHRLDLHDLRLHRVRRPCGGGEHPAPSTIAATYLNPRLRFRFRRRLSR